MPKFLDQYGSATGPFGFPMPEVEARALDKELSESNEDIRYVKIQKSGFEYFIDGEKADVSTITDDSVDEDMEVVEAKSINWDIFRKNPLVTFNHDYSTPPVGKSLWQKLVGNRVWKAKTQFAPKPENFPTDKEWFPDSLFHLIKSGFLPGKSIGGIAKIRVPTNEEQSLYKGVKQIRYDLRVYEYSVVTRQCNNNAIVEAVSKGMLALNKDRVAEIFPELALQLREIINSNKPVIKDFVTAETYRNRVLADVTKALLDVQKRTPEIIENTMAKLLGKV